MQTVVFVAIVVFALVAIVVSGRTRRDPMRLAEPTPDGLLPIGVEAGGTVTATIIPWSDVYRVTLLMKRRIAGPPSYAFELRSETAGTLYVKRDRDGAVERLLAESHHLPGFDHNTLVATLSRNDSADVVVFSR